MTLPTHDAQPSRSIPRRPQMVYPTHSISTLPPKRPATPFSPLSSPARSVPDQEEMQHHEHALDFATHSWDLATGGLKTLTAKREFPRRPDRRQPELSSPEQQTAPASSYKLTLIILTCVVLMLIGGGMVLLVMLQL